MKSRTHLLFYKSLIGFLLGFCLTFSLAAKADLHDISRIFHSSPTLSQFEICHSGGCAEVSTVSLSDEEWQQVSAVFDNNAQNATQERAQIAQAIGVLETLVGNTIGTSGDLAGTFGNSDHAGQLDCNDEAINSTTYMRLLKANGLMQLHEIEDTRTRNFFFTGWPHSTAVIRDIATGERFAVDSWFYDNGHPATIVPFAIWKANYKPEDSPIGKTRLVKPDAKNAVVTQSNHLPVENVPQ
jgi:hypothetical protein